MDEPLFYGAPYFKQTQVNDCVGLIVCGILYFMEKGTVQLSSITDESVDLM